MYAIPALRHMVERSGMSGRALSRKMGNSDSYVHLLISGERNPSIDNAARLADACGFDLLIRERSTGDETTIEPLRYR